MPLGYYEAFPPKSMKTRIETRGGRKVLVVTEDVAVGQVIYKVLNDECSVCT